MNSVMRPARLRIAVTAFVLLLPIAAHSLWDYIEVQRLVREVERIQEKREPITEQEAIGRREAGPEEHGAASYYLAAAMLALGRNPYPVNAPVRDWLTSATPAQQLPPGLATALRDLVAESSDALLLADKAAQLPFTGFPAGTDYSYQTASIGTLSELIAARSLSLSASGNGDAALSSMISGLQARRALQESRSWFARSSDVAAVLSFTRPSLDALRRAQAALEDAERPEQASAGFLRERARFLEMTWRRFYGYSPNAPRDYRLPMRGVTETVLRPWRSHKLVETLQLWAELAAVAGMPWPQRAEAGARVLERYPQEQDSRYSRYFDPLIGRDRPLGLFGRVLDPTPLIVDRCSIVAIAVERFRHESGSLPAALSQIVPRYLASIPLDPLSGQPLMFRSSADGYTIYSVGRNGRDDAGDLTTPPATAGGRRPVRRTNSADIGIRIVALQ